MSTNGKKAARVLLVGESWMRHTVHVKGFDSFSTSDYEEGAGIFIEALRSEGIDVSYIRAHEIGARFPETKKQLEEYNTVIISDVGANSFLLGPATFVRSEVTANRLAAVADYVRGGGGLVMVGGYLSFSGIDGKARYKASPLAEVLPVDMLDHDDRVERPEGVGVTVERPEHLAVRGVAGAWPALLGYNRLVAKEGSTTVARCDGDPLLVTCAAGEGRAVAFASDLAPHWAPPSFVKWSHYARLWSNIVLWAGSVDLAGVV